MLELHKLGSCIREEIEQRIIPTFAPEFRLIGLSLYGSRVSGKPRPDSDVDGLVLLSRKETPSPLKCEAFEYAGQLRSTSKELAAELRFYTKASIDAELNSGDLIRANALSTSFIAYDPTGSLRLLKSESERLLDQALQDLLQQAIDADRKSWLSMLSLALREQFSIMKSALKRDQETGIWSLFYEFLQKFYVYVQLLRFQDLNLTKLPLDSTHRALLFLSRGEGARFLCSPNPEVLYPWFQTFLQNLSLNLNRGELTLEQKLCQIESQMHECLWEFFPDTYVGDPSAEVWIEKA